MTALREIKDGPALEYLRELVSGPLGRVSLAHVVTGPESGKLVIARSIPLELLAQEELERVLCVAREVARIRHARIARLLGAHCQDGQLVVLSEDVGGLPLTVLRRMTLAHEVRVAPAVALRIAHDVMRGAQALRRECVRSSRSRPTRVVFADTVFVASFGESLLSAVGVAAELYRCDSLRKLPELVQDLAPEEILSTDPADERADVFALGVILWELLSRRRLFEARTTEQAIEAVLHAPIPRLDEDVGLDLPDSIVEIVGRAASRDPELRYASLPEMRAAIDCLPAKHVATDAEMQVFLQSIAGGSLPTPRDALGLGASTTPLGFHDHENSPASTSPTTIAFDEADPPRARRTSRVALLLGAVATVVAAVGVSVFRPYERTEYPAAGPSAAAAAPSPELRSLGASERPGDSEPERKDTGELSTRRLSAAQPRPTFVPLEHRPDAGADAATAMDVASVRAKSTSLTARRHEPGTVPSTSELSDADTPNGRWGI